MINSRIVYARACAEKAPLVLWMPFCRWRQLSHDTLFQRVYRKQIGSKGEFQCNGEDGGSDAYKCMTERQYDFVFRSCFICRFVRFRG